VQFRFGRRSALSAAIAVPVLAAMAMPAVAQQVLPPAKPAKPGCVAVVRFVNSRDGLPDSRFGVRLNVEGSAYAVLPSDANGEVQMYVADSAPVSFSVIPLYIGELYANQDFSTPGVGAGDQQAGCGYQVITTPGGA
jgi:hypothetical protein